MPALSTILFAIAPFFGIAVGFGALQWALGAHRRERAPWLELLRGPGANHGWAAEGGGDVVAPFSGRRCLAFTCEIVTQEFFGNQVTWRRVFEDGGGRIAIKSSDGTIRGSADVTHGRAIFPRPLEQHGRFMLDTANTVYQGNIGQLPQHLDAFLRRLDPATQTEIFRPSGQFLGAKRVYFNEQIVVPGQAVVVVAPHDGLPTHLGLGTLESERARVAKLPVAGELFGAIIAGVLSTAVLCAIASGLAPR